MEIPNLSPQTSPQPVTEISHSDSPISVGVIVLILVLAVSIGFWASRFTPVKNDGSGPSPKALVINPENLKDQSQIEVGKVYGNLSKAFKDSATGTIEKGSINGEGTHILNRPGGASQRASLTSSVVDLDLFVGRNVEIKGETNASTKTSWLLDVGTIKVLE